MSKNATVLDDPSGRIARLFNDWEDTKIRAANLKRQEADLRIEITDLLLDGKSVGTHTFFIDGMEIKAVKKINTRVDQKLVQAAMDSHAFTAEQEGCFRTKYELALANLKKLSDVEAADLEAFITQTPAMPSLEIAG